MALDAEGKFGEFGGQWVAETLMPALHQVEAAFKEAQEDPTFWAELQHLHQNLGGRPTPIYNCNLGGGNIWLKREDLVHGGAHKFNNVMGQALLAKRMGKARIIAETGAGQHGVATAMAGASMGIPVEVFMGAKDVERQAQNVYQMKLFGAVVHPVHGGSATLKDAVNQTLREWAGSPEDTYYCVGSVVGPHPFPFIVREFQKIIGEEARAQFLAQNGKLPDAVIACVGGGSNAMGSFHAFRGDKVELIGVEAGGLGIETGKHAASLAAGRKGILHGALTILMQDDDGQVIEPHSISAGLDYPGVGPEHAELHTSGRVHYTSATDEEALAAAHALCRQDGILPALESAHALAEGLKQANAGKTVLVNLSGRGDKDIAILQAHND